MLSTYTIDERRLVPEQQLMDQELYEILEDGKLALLKDWMSVGNPIDRLSEDWETPLHIVARLGHLQVCEYLIEKLPGQVNARDQSGMTPLFIADLYMNEDCAEILLKAGADPNLKDKEGYSPLQAAANRGNFSIVDLLLRYGANLESKNNKGQTPLMNAVFNGDDVVVERLLQRDANVLARDREGYTALQIATKEGHASIVKRLASTSININEMDGHGVTALLMAAKNQRKDICEILIAHGADRGKGASHLLEAYRGMIDTPPLVAAAKHGLKEQVLGFLEAGHDPAEMYGGRRPAQYAELSGQPEIASLIKAFEARTKVQDLLQKTSFDPKP